MLNKIHCAQRAQMQSKILDIVPEGNDYLS